MTVLTERGLTERVSPLAGWSERFAAAGTASFAIRERAGAAQINLRCDPALARQAQAALGFALPVKANTWEGDATPPHSGSAQMNG